MQKLRTTYSRAVVLTMGLCLACVTLFYSCGEDFLDVSPTGSLNEQVLGTKTGVEGLLIGAYSMMLARGDWYGGISNWVSGSIRGGESNKGSDAGDQGQQINPILRYETAPTNSVVESEWRSYYEGVSRANSTLSVLKASNDPTITEEDRTRIASEALFLRGLYYFYLKITYNSIPYFDEEVGFEQVITTMNSPDVWVQIEDDVQAAVDGLPETQAAAGRVNKWAAMAFLGKIQLYQGKFAEAQATLEEVIENGTTNSGTPYGLLDDYTQNFNAEFDNSQESVFAVQAAVNTGSVNNANYGFILTFPYNNGPGACCGFFQPSFDLANSFRVNDDGLPFLNFEYRDAENELLTDQGLEADDAFTADDKPVDPRLDFSVGRRGVPYLDWGIFPGKTWIRDQGYAGPYSPKKYVYYQSQEGSLTDGSSWTKGLTAVNYQVIRFADVLLMAAEANAQNNNLERATELVNMIRMRAANEDAWVRFDDGTLAANYQISTYDDFGSQQEALDAIYMERKLELNNEGFRFFDLVRWGIAEDYINDYIDYESDKLVVALGGARFNANRDEYYPIPQSQIDLQGADVLKQNPGY